MTPHPVRLAVVVLLTARSPGAHPDPQQPAAAPAARIACDGTACGGSGGARAAPFLYRLEPGRGAPLASVEVGVEDGDLGRYTLLASPPGWGLSVHPTPLAHELGPSEHGRVSAEAGSCPWVLRFSAGPSGHPQDSAFELGYAYTRPSTGLHDAGWRASDGTRARWEDPLGRAQGPVHSPARCNVLVVVLDDVGTDKLRAFDDPAHARLHPFAPTPNLDALAAEGLRFTSFYVNPVCTTTRACLQTGRYAFRTGLGDFVDRHVPGLDDCEVTLAELLKRGFPAPELRPYAAGAFGKWHLTFDVDCSGGPPDCCRVPGSPACNPGHPVRNGYDHFAGFRSNTNHHFNGWELFRQDAGPESVPVRTTPPDCHEPACAAASWTGNVVRADAVRWIRAQTTTFFAYVAFNPPHGRFQAPPWVTEDGRSLLSAATRAELAAHELEPMDGPGPNDASNPGYGAKAELLYRAMLEAIDAELGYLRAELGEAAANTMIFVVSDNGTTGDDPATPEREGVVLAPFHDARHGKRTVYQLSVRVPMLVQGPLVPAAERGGACAELVEAVDLWRTLRDLAGADEGAALAGHACADRGLDSVSFLPLLQAPRGPGARRLAFAQVFDPNTDVRHRCTHDRALTDGAFKYVRKQRKKDGNDPDDACEPERLADAPVYTEELYDLRSDPDEARNLLESGTELSPEARAALDTLKTLVTGPRYGGD